jgi:hypothetical protein
LFNKLDAQEPTNQVPEVYKEVPKYDRREYSNTSSYSHSNSRKPAHYVPYQRNHCRYWIAGHCTSKDCKFYHDIDLRGSQPYLFKHVPCKHGKKCYDRYCVMSHK